MRRRHIKMDRLLNHALNQQESALTKSERSHLEGCSLCRKKVDEYRRSFQSVSKDEIPHPEINRFRDMFQTAWESRQNDTPGNTSSMGDIRRRFLRVPSMWVSSILLCLVLGSGFGIARSVGSYSENTARFAGPVLTAGQQILEEPEITHLLPDVDRATVIVNRERRGEDKKEKYVVHGYLEDDSVQVVWQL